MSLPDLTVPIAESSVPGCRCGQDCACTQYAFRLEQRWKIDLRRQLDADRHLKQVDTELHVALDAIEAAIEAARRCDDVVAPRVGAVSPPEPILGLD